MMDRTADGRAFRMLTIVDEYTREWLERVGVKTLYFEPGSPWENGYVESFNGRLRDELLDREVFDTLLEAKVLIKRWRKAYNTIRPHSSLGYRPPAHSWGQVNQRRFGANVKTEVVTHLYFLLVVDGDRFREAFALLRILGTPGLCVGLARIVVGGSCRKPEAGLPIQKSCFLQPLRRESRLGVLGLRVENVSQDGCRLSLSPAGAAVAIRKRVIEMLGKRLMGKMSEQSHATNGCPEERINARRRSTRKFAPSHGPLRLRAGSVPQGDRSGYSAGERETDEGIRKRKS